MGTEAARGREQLATSKSKKLIGIFRLAKVFAIRSQLANCFFIIFSGSHVCTCCTPEQECWRLHVVAITVAIVAIVAITVAIVANT